MAAGWRRNNALRSQVRGRAGEGARLAELFEPRSIAEALGFLPREAMLSGGMAGKASAEMFGP